MAVEPASTSNMEQIIKEYYGPNHVANLTYTNNPLFGMISKFRDWSGNNYRLPQQYVNPTGMSTTFSTAQANQKPSVYADFILTPVAFYSLATVDGTVILQTRNDKGAFVNALTREIDSAMRSHGNMLQVYLYGNGSGAMAQVASVTSPNIVTLKDKTMVARFLKNMKITSCADETGGTPATGVVLDKTNLQQGTLTFTSAYPTGTVADWYLFLDGSYNNVLTGLLGWVPTTSPTTGDSFFSQDRSYDPTRLAGVPMPCKGWSMLQTLTTLAYQIFANAGVGPDTTFLHPSKYSQLINEISSQSIFRPDAVQSSEAPSITYRSAVVETAWGPIRLYPDVFCPSQQLWMLKFDSWSLYIQQDLASIIEDDNQRILRTSSSDSVEVRIRSYLNLGCDYIAANGVADFSTAAA